MKNAQERSLAAARIGLWAGKCGRGEAPARSERRRVSHGRGAGIEGVPASARVGGSGGAKPPGDK
jgi:hypothetical protein